jgi:hypothetical protein
MLFETILTFAVALGVPILLTIEEIAHRRQALRTESRAMTARPRPERPRIVHTRTARPTGVPLSDHSREIAQARYRSAAS